MKNLVVTLLLGLMVFGSDQYTGGTTAAVTLVGGVIKTSHGDNVQKKYKRKDCPVCKGQGWYISGDKITKVNCGYCEEDKKAQPAPVIAAPAYEAPKVSIVTECETGVCPTPSSKAPIQNSVPYRSTTPPRRILRRW